MNTAFRINDGNQIVDTPNRTDIALIAKPLRTSPKAVT
jgi:hypothetical protein